MPFSWKKTRRPILALAPMAGYTDSAFRQAVKKIAPDIICFSELTSADGLKYAFNKNQRHVFFNRTEKPIILQLFGKKPAFFAEAAKKIEALGANGIDINMGCPARKVVGSSHGSALIQKPELAAEIIHQTQKAVSIPVSVKTRLGFKEYSWPKFLAFVKQLEAAGAKLLTIHGRTTAQGFSGQANWRPIYQLKKHLKIPIIGNGDIDSVKTATTRLKNLDGIMVGRVLFYNPWLMAELNQRFYGKKSPNTAKFTPPTNFTEKIPFILKHAALKQKIKGQAGLMEMRKHLAAYIKGLPGASHYRSRLVQVNTLAEIKTIFKEITVQLKTHPR